MSRREPEGVKLTSHELKIDDLIASLLLMEDVFCYGLVLKIY